MEYLIFMDVSGDISPLAPGHDQLHYVCMDYSLGSDTLVCSGPEQPEILHRFYEGQRSGDLTKTSLITPFIYEEVLTPWFEQGYSVLYLCLSSGLSSTFASALSVQEKFRQKYPDQIFLPVDTLSATAGMGLLAERALRNREAGMSITENAADLSSARKHLHHHFLVQDLMYLKRGGRVSPTTAIAGSLLNIKPLLIIDDEGKLTTTDKKRGAKAAVKALLDAFEADFDPSYPDPVYVIHADAPELARIWKPG